MLKAAQFVEGSDQDIGAESLVIEAVDQFQDVLRVEHPHVPRLLLNGIQIQPVYHDRLNRIDLPGFQVLALLHLAKTAAADGLPRHELLLLRTIAQLAEVHVALPDRRCHHLIQTYYY